MTTIEVVAKVDDRCRVCCYDNGYWIAEYDGEVPKGLGIGSGDYIRLTIDNSSGQIRGWETLTAAELKRLLGTVEEAN